MPNNRYLLLVSLLSVIYLSACAERTIPDISPAPALTDVIKHNQTETIESVEMSEPVETTESSQEKTILLEMLACTERAERLQPNKIAKEISQLQAKVQLSQALDQSAGRDHLVQRFSLACLLSQDSANDAQLARAQTLLEGLERDLVHEEERQLVQLIERAISLKIRLRQHQAKLADLRAQNRELLEKIEQLKGLERDLDVTNLPTLESSL